MRNRGLFPIADHALVRQMNLSLLMHLLRVHAPISRAALSQMTGLNKSTVSDLIAELRERQVVCELGVLSSGTGRPGTLLMLNPGAGCIVSCEIRADHVQVMLSDFAAEVIWRVREEVSPGMYRDSLLSHTMSLLHQGVDRGVSAGYALLGVAVGVPGIVDHATGTLLVASSLGWNDVPLKALLEQEAFGAPVFVDNEANMALLGEYYFGAAQGFDEVVYISAGADLGGGIIRDGHLCQGVSGGAGQFGHVTILPEGELCSCGNRGCWETLASQQALFRSISRLRGQGPRGAASKWAHGCTDNLSVSMVVEAAEVGDAVALQALRELGRWLGIGIASLVNALNPELVVFGGTLSAASSILLPVVEEQIEERALPWNCEAVHVVRGTLGSDACVRGGVATVYQYVLSQPDLFDLRDASVEEEQVYVPLLTGNSPAGF